MIQTLPKCFAPVFVTVPTHFSHTLREYASQGFRVLGLAYKHLAKDTDVSTVERSAVLFSVHRTYIQQSHFPFYSKAFQCTTNQILLEQTEMTQMIGI